MLPRSVRLRLGRQLQSRKELPQFDLHRGVAWVELPDALERKYPQAAQVLAWQLSLPRGNCRADRPGFRETPEESKKRRRVMQARWRCRFFVIAGATRDTPGRFRARPPTPRAVGGVAASAVLPPLRWPAPMNCSTGCARATRTPGPRSSPGIGTLCAAVALRLDRRLLGRIDVSDVVQETYLEAFRRRADYLRQPGVPFAVWLRWLARERVLQAHRQHLFADKRAVGREVAPLPVESSALVARALLARGPSPSQALTAAELAEQLRQALEQSDPRPGGVANGRPRGLMEGRARYATRGRSRPGKTPSPSRNPPLPNTQPRSRLTRAQP